MVKNLREWFNHSFTEEKYDRLLGLLSRKHPGQLQFRVAETPVFLPQKLKVQVEEAAEAIMNTLRRPDFKKMTDRAIPAAHFVPGDEGHCQMICLDFGICDDGSGGLVPRLIEMQGFPTIMFFQKELAAAYREAYSLPDDLTTFFNGYDGNRYQAALKEIILGNHSPEEVVLMDVHPDKQKTRIDFWDTQDCLGIPVIDVADVIAEGNGLFYKTSSGTRQRIRRIYNRMIFDDLDTQKAGLSEVIDFTRDFEVEWVPHPNWFYRISKYALPFIKSPYVPDTYFVSELKSCPEDLENYVLKPLYSFAGQGVIIDIKPEDLKNIRDPEHWILQRKVQYADAIVTPDGFAKCEIRLIYLQSGAMERPVLVNNLVRLSKGKMIGVRYNENFKWVGGSIAFFEP